SSAPSYLSDLECEHVLSRIGDTSVTCGAFVGVRDEMLYGERMVCLGNPTQLPCHIYENPRQIDVQILVVRILNHKNAHAAALQNTSEFAERAPNRIEVLQECLVVVR